MFPRLPSLLMVDIGCAPKTVLRDSKHGDPVLRGKCETRELRSSQYGSLARSADGFERETVTTSFDSKLKRDQSVVLVGHSDDSNALGRLLSLALVAQELGDLTCFAFGNGNLWPGAAQFPFEVKSLSSSWKTVIDEELAKHSGQDRVVWLAKGISPLDKVAKHISKHWPCVRIVLDFDDDDVGLANSFRDVSLVNRIRLNRMRRGHPLRVAASQRRASTFAHGFTFSTWALAGTFPVAWSPRVRIPHVRPLLPSPGSRRRIESKIRVGLFGTIRAHKGGDLLRKLIHEHEDVVAVAFEGSGISIGSDSKGALELIPSNTPLLEAYALVDVALIPMDVRQTGASLQLPAKLVDALRAGTPVLATSTEPIKEIGGEALHVLPIDSSVAVAHRLVWHVARTDRGLGRSAFEALLTPQAAALQFAALIAAIGASERMPSPAK